MATLTLYRDAAFALVQVTLAAACARPAPSQLGNRFAGGDDITLFRDAAVIRQRIVVTATDTRPATVTAQLPHGVAADQIVVLERGGLTIVAVHARTQPRIAVDDAEPEPEPEPEGQGPERDTPLPRRARKAAPPGPARTLTRPTEVRLDVLAPRPGTYIVELAYTTDRVGWDVAYTMTASPTRDRSDLRGALAIRNETGVVMKMRSARVIDAELVAWRGKSAETVAAALVGGAKGSTPAAQPRELGSLELRDGETRVEVVRDPARRMRSVLVYDPIGTALDNARAEPVRDPAFGVEQQPSKRVTESFEVARDPRGAIGLPAGPVRLLERTASGALKVLGEARLFDASTRVATVDTIAIGGATGVTARRERRELTVDDHTRRLTEEFQITVDNTRAFPVDILLREHLYRGQNWRLAFHSANSATKDGAQQISLRTRVPARSQIKILYVVVYTWTR